MISYLVNTLSIVEARSMVEMAKERFSSTTKDTAISVVASFKIDRQALMNVYVSDETRRQVNASSINTLRTYKNLSQALAGLITLIETARKYQTASNSDLVKLNFLDQVQRWQKTDLSQEDPLTQNQRSFSLTVEKLKSIAPTRLSFEIGLQLKLNQSMRYYGEDDIGVLLQAPIKNGLVSSDFIGRLVASLEANKVIDVVNDEVSFSAIAPYLTKAGNTLISYLIPKAERRVTDPDELRAIGLLYQWITHVDQLDTICELPIPILFSEVSTNEVS